MCYHHLRSSREYTDQGLIPDLLTAWAIYDIYDSENLSTLSQLAQLQ